MDISISTYPIYRIEVVSISGNVLEAVLYKDIDDAYKAFNSIDKHNKDDYIALIMLDSTKTSIDNTGYLLDIR